jgi:hypothetical protein
MKAALALFLVLWVTPSWAFPDNAVLEDFTGADNTTPPNGNWTNAPLVGATSASIRIRSNGGTTASSSVEADAYYSAASFNANQEAYLTMILASGTATYSCVFLRLANIGSSTTDGYDVCWFNGTVRISRLDNGVETLLGSSIVQAGDPDDAIGATAVGDQICAYFNNDAAGWTQVGCRTDSTYSAGGYIGLQLNHTSNTVAVIDNFGGGNVASTRRAVAPILFQ